MGDQTGIATSKRDEDVTAEIEAKARGFGIE
jgi:hypothetical protein